MRTFLATSILAIVLISSWVVAEAGPVATSGPAGAPVVRVQPRGGNFTPHSRANEVEQKKLSTFDARQEKLDETLDNKLSICRC
jgi:hypothetical protein